MGLDAVEILMEVEETFEITFADSEAESILTPRDLIESILRKVGEADPSVCLTQRAFNLLRQILLRRLPLKRRDIRPSSRLAELVPKPQRAQLLSEIAGELKTGPLPDVIRPPWLVKMITLQSLAVGLAMGLTLHRWAPEASGSMGLWVGLAAALAAHICTWFATARFRTDFPSLIATIGDLSRWVTAHKSDLASPIPGRWTREQVAERVRQIVINQLGCERRYREDASFVKDLGLG